MFSFHIRDLAGLEWRRGAIRLAPSVCPIGHIVGQAEAMWGHQPGVQAWISRAMACTPRLWVGHGAAGQPPLKSSFWGKESQPSLRFRLASQDLSPRPLALLFPSWPCTRAAKPVGEGQIKHTFHLQWLPACLVWGGIPAY